MADVLKSPRNAGWGEVVEDEDAVFLRWGSNKCFAFSEDVGDVSVWGYKIVAKSLLKKVWWTLCKGEFRWRRGELITG